VGGLRGPARGSAAPTLIPRRPAAQADEKLKVAATEPEQFSEGYEEFMAANKEILTEYSEIDQDNDKSEAYILQHTQLLSEHATGALGQLETLSLYIDIWIDIDI